MEISRHVELANPKLRNKKARMTQHGIDKISDLLIY